MSRFPPLNLPTSNLSYPLNSPPSMTLHSPYTTRPGFSPLGQRASRILTCFHQLRAIGVSYSTARAIALAMA